MKIVNVMFGEGLGGIEQAFVDYAHMLKKEGHVVENLIQPDAAIADTLWQVSSRIQKISNRGYWDIFASSRIAGFLREFRPDAIICHGNRAYRLLNRANSARAALVAITHNYQFRHFMSADAIFCITKNLEKSVIEKGFPESRIYKIPNSIRQENGHFTFKSWHERTPVIGAMGRFVKKKGFDQLLIALSVLARKNISFKAIIAGEGEEKENLMMAARNLKLSDKISFPGWINNKEKFFENIDIFCLPSLHEPFGIVLLEALNYGKPVISGNSEGPSEIIRDEENGLLYDLANPGALAAALQRVIENQKLAAWIAEGGYKTVGQEYGSDIVGAKITAALKEIVKRKK